MSFVVFNCHSDTISLLLLLGGGGAYNNKRRSSAVDVDWFVIFKKKIKCVILLYLSFSTFVSSFLYIILTRDEDTVLTYDDDPIRGTSVWS